MSEEDIYEGCRRGDNAARRALYDRYGGALLAIGLRYVADMPAAEDLLHDVFIRAFTHFDSFTFRGEGSIKAWMARMMVNAAVDYIRKKQAIHAVEAGTLKEDEPIEEDCDAADIPANKIMEFIRELPDGYRTVFNLFVFEKKSHREIAALLGINEKSSSSQLTRARQLLARRINQYLNDENTSRYGTTRK